MVCAIEDAGFEIRDSIEWIYATGFPHSRNIGNGRGTSLKPAHEPICLARKPFATTVEQNVLRYGTGALNIDACRIGVETITTVGSRKQDTVAFGNDGGMEPVWHSGRWPANIIFDEARARELDFQSGTSTAGKPRWNRGCGGIWAAGNGIPCGPQYGDTGGASRFFYVVKASTKERELGCEALPEVRRTDGRVEEHHVPHLRTTKRRNHHPTVKPIDLMRHLITLVTPPEGIVLDPFMGSGSTGCAAVVEGRHFVGFELSPDYVRIAIKRIEYWQAERRVDEDTEVA